MIPRICTNPFRKKIQNLKVKEETFSIDLKDVNLLSNLCVYELNLCLTSLFFFYPALPISSLFPFLYFMVRLLWSSFHSLFVHFTHDKYFYIHEKLFQLRTINDLEVFECWYKLGTNKMIATLKCRSILCSTLCVSVFCKP